MSNKEGIRKLPKQVGAHDDDNVVVEEEENRISNLGDDILVSIISRLTLREATATSVLSRRWQPLHTRISRLIFLPDDQICYEFKKISLVRKEFRKYINRINHTLNSYEGGQMLNELRIHMHREEGADIQSWLKFGLSREVQILDIRMTNCGTYSLQLENLMKSSTSVQGLKSMRELCLCNVDVNDMEIKLLVSSNCPNLESLSIQCTDMLRHISIVGHPKLQHLNLSRVTYVESIEIENLLNLVSMRCFDFRHWPSNYVVRLNNLPKLIELDTDDNSRHFLFKLPSWICSQLLVIRVLSEGIDICESPMFPRLINVKHLELEFDYSWRIPGSTSAIEWVVVLKAFNFLETLQLKTVWEPYDKFKFGVRGEVHEYISNWYKVSPKLHKVKLSGYMEKWGELEFIVFIIQHAPGLKELIVEPCRASKLIRQVTINNLWKKLGPIIPNSLNLVVI